MAHEKGTYLGSVRDIETLRGRCVIDEDCGCWHLRSARGKPIESSGAMRLHVYGKGRVPAGKATWELAHGREMPKGRVASRTCESIDCVNPDHIKALTPKQRGAMWVQDGRMRTTAKILAGKLVCAARERAKAASRARVLEAA